MGSEINSLNWDVIVHHPMGSDDVGIIKPVEGVEIKIEKWGKLAGSTPKDHETFLARLEGFGCATSAMFDTMAHCKAYLKFQLSPETIAKWNEIKRQRDEIADKMKPLQELWDSNNEDILNLLRRRENYENHIHVNKRFYGQGLFPHNRRTATTHYVGVSNRLRAMP